MKTINQQISDIIQAIQELETHLDSDMSVKISRAALHSIQALDAYLNKDRFVFKQVVYDAINIIDRIESEIVRQTEKELGQY